MKKGTKITLSIIALIVVLVVVIAYKNWNSISAFIDSFKYSQEEVQGKLEESKEQLDEYLSGEGGLTVRDLTEDEAAALNEGKLTEDEVVELLVGSIETTPTPEPTPTHSNETAGKVEKPTSTPTPTPTPVSPEVAEAKKKLAEAVARLYVQKNKYLGKLDTVEAEVRADFIQICKDNNIKHTDPEYKTEKNKFLTRYLSTVASWEKECDGIVYGIINEIRAALKEAGESSSVADKLEEAYLNEKKLKKTYFINRYMD